MPNPLNKQDIQNLRKAQFELNELKQDLELAAQAGIQIAELEARYAHLQGVIQALLETYQNKQ